MFVWMLAITGLNLLHRQIVSGPTEGAPASICHETSTKGMHNGVKMKDISM